MTIKAVRHYHQRGLPAEPPRDSSGYRRYSAEHAIHLIKIKTLAEAGVPLARVKKMLSADSDLFAKGIAGIDRNLRERMRHATWVRVLVLGPFEARDDQGRLVEVVGTR
ncbi:MAG: MerR family transcriptional regulator, partial [Solirubrobacteraceae bacterium]